MDKTSLDLLLDSSLSCWTLESLSFVTIRACIASLLTISPASDSYFDPFLFHLQTFSISSSL